MGAVDLVVQIGLAVGLMAGIGVLLLQTGADTAWVDTAVVLAMVSVLVGYPVACETLSRGRTLGKLVLGLRVLRTDGGPIVFRHALARALAGFIVDFGLLSLFTGLIGVVVSASSARGGCG